MSRVQELVEQSAASDVPVLITGEMGVRKDLVAREIHRQSARGGNALFDINCASLPHDFFDGDIPGAEPSSLGAAGRRMPSLREAVGGGTLFLDDIGELSPGLQEKLLQALRPSDAPRSGNEDRQLADFRLIGATHRDLAQEVAAGTFCEELYRQVNLIHIHVPPLREHPEDIPALLLGFMRQHGRHEGWQGGLPDNLLARFCSYEWPGNVCELENAILRFIALKDPAYVLDELEAQSEGRARRSTGVPSNGSAQPAPTTVQHGNGNGNGHGNGNGNGNGKGHSVDLKELGRRASALAEREAIREMLVSTMGNKKEAAQRLGISYKALLYKIRDLGLAPPRRAPSSSLIALRRAHRA